MDKIELLEKRIETLEKQTSTLLEIAGALNDKIDDYNERIKDIVECMSDESDVNSMIFDSMESQIKHNRMDIEKLKKCLNGNTFLHIKF